MTNSIEFYYTKNIQGKFGKFCLPAENILSVPASDRKRVPASDRKRVPAQPLILIKKRFKCTFNSIYT